MLHPNVKVSHYLPNLPLKSFNKDRVSKLCENLRKIHGNPTKPSSGTLTRI